MNQETIEEYLNDMLEQSEREIDKVFAKRLKALLGLLSDMYRKYAEDGSISRSQIYAYRRFEKEMELIKRELHQDYQELYKEINKLMKEQYIDNLLMSAFVYEMATQLEMNFTVPSIDTVTAAILNPIKELTLDALMTQHRNEIVRKIRIELASGIQAGEDYATMAKRLEDAVNFSRAKARRVARTEAGRVQTTARLDSIEQAESYISPAEEEPEKKEPPKPEKKPKKTKKKKPKKEKPKKPKEKQEPETTSNRFWMATLDTHTRKSHRKLDGQLAGSDNLFEYKGMKARGPSLWNVASMDINCRCDVGLKIAGEYPEVRRSRDYSDADYQQRLAERMDQLMADEGLTEKQAERKAKRQVFPPSVVKKWQVYEDWLKDQPKEK